MQTTVRPNVFIPTSTEVPEAKLERFQIAVRPNRPNVFNATSEDMPAMIAAVLHEMTTLRAEVRALTEIVRGRVPKSKFDSFSMAITNKAFEETQEQMNNFGIKIQLVPES